MQSELRRKWKLVIKRLPPSRREAWLDSQEGRSSLGAATCNQLLKTLRGQFAAVTAALASDAWMDAWIYQGEFPPGFEFDDKGRLRYEPTTAVKLRLSRCYTRGGLEHPPGTDPRAMPIAGPGSRRWTPPQAVELEDSIDELSPGMAAEACVDWEESPSANAIKRLEVTKGKEIRVRLRHRRLPQDGNQAAGF